MAQRTLQAAEVLALGLVWGFCEAFGAFILVTGEISLSAKRSGIVWSTGNDALVMAMVFIAIGSLIAPLLVARWLPNRRPFIAAMVVSPIVHLAIAWVGISLR